ncbi:MAG: hypothetical protein Q9163_000504 [Psora crenata]
MSSPSSLKRTFNEAGLEPPTQEGNVDQPALYSSSQCLPATAETSTTALGTSALSSCTPSVANGPGPLGDTASCVDSMNTPISTTNKKPKLAFVEEEGKRIKRGLKEQHKAEDCAKREEERLRKEEEKTRKAEKKKIKDAEKEEKRKVREEKDRLREEERRQKEVEKNKKDKSQLRLNAFFGQPTLPTGNSTGSPTRDDPSPLGSRRSSIAENDALGSERRSRSRSLPGGQKPRLPDYERAFPPFFVQSHTSLAPLNRFSKDVEGLSEAQIKIDASLNALVDDSEKQRAIDVQKSSYFARYPSRSRYRPAPTVKEIMKRMHRNSGNPVDLTDAEHGPNKPADPLSSVSLKILKFAEDIRPPYIGTYTKLTDQPTIAKLSRNPFNRYLPEANYDYDSEAEWEDPGEGEDLNSEGEEELDEEEEDEMEGFLDDEGATDARAVRCRPLLGDLEPTCTGICWSGEPAASDLSKYSIDMLLDFIAEDPCFPIDPYTTSYWQQDAPPKLPQSSIPATQSKSMEPPALPPNSIDGSISTTLPSPLQQPGQNQSNSGQIHGHPNPTPSSLNNPIKAVKRLIPNELIHDFKRAVQGSDLTKLGLVEVLKKQFPKQNKDVLKDTLDVLAERLGERQAEKKWVLRENPLNYSGLR